MTLLHDEMVLLAMTPTSFLNSINSVAEKNLLEQAKLKYGDKSEQKRYLEENRKRSNMGKHITFRMTRKTLYNLLHRDTKVSSKSAMLVLQTINDIRKSRGLKPTTLEKLGLVVYQRWQFRKNE